MSDGDLSANTAGDAGARTSRPHHDPASTTRSRLAVPPLVLTIFSFAAVAVAYGPLLVEFGQNLWAKPYYQHFPYILLASGALFTQRVRDLSNPVSGTSRWTVAAYVLAWLILLVAYLIPSPLLAAVSIVLLLGGWLYALTRRLGWSFPVGPWLLLWLVIPPPAGLDYRLIATLQRTSSGLASRALDLLAVNHLMDGNALVLPSKELFVDEACSGIVSVISIVACAAIYAVWRQRATPHTLLLMTLAAGWATLLNVVRITVIAASDVWYQLDLTEGLPHTLVALVAFSLALLALVASDWLLQALLAEVEARRQELTGEPLRFGLPLVRLWDSIANADQVNPALRTKPARWERKSAYGAGLSLGLLPVLAFAGLSVTQFTQLPAADGAVPIASTLNTAVFVERLTSGVLPDRLAGLTLTNIEHERRGSEAGFGENSVIHTYKSDAGKSYRVSCDFAFQGRWHELSVCYRGIGWRLNSSEVCLLADASTGEEAVKHDTKRLELTKPDGTAAFVTYCAAFTNGEPIEALEELSYLGVVASRFWKPETPIGRTSFQSQVLVSRPEEVTDLDREVAAQLLRTAHQEFVKAAQEAR